MDVLRFRRRRVEKDGGWGSLPQEAGQATGVVVVAVTEHHSVQSSQGDAKGFRIVPENPALAGVEQNPLSVGLDQQRQAVFGQEPGHGDVVVGQHGDPQVLDHRETSVRSVSGWLIDSPFSGDRDA